MLTSTLSRTKGGVGGTTATVTNLAQLSAAANASGPGIVIIQGNIVGKAKVQVGSDKTIVGKTGSCWFTSPIANVTKRTSANGISPHSS